MYPLIRLANLLINAKKQPKLAFGDTSEITFRCRPWDLDMFMEMNNGRVLTLYDLGRFDLSIRTGLGDVLKQNRWGLAVAGSSTRYRKRVHLFNKVTMKTAVAGIDEKWFYIAQSMWVNGNPTSSALLRTCITRKGGAVPTDEVKEALGAQDWQPEMPQWVSEWRLAEDHRPWPPTP